MPESVYHVVQLGRQAGTLQVPGAQVAATKLYPVSEPVIIELDRATQYPPQDWGRNAAARAETGFHGVRGANFSLPSQFRFGDAPDLLEAHYSGDIVPTSLGGGLYRWEYPLEVGLPTLVPYTVESGTEVTQDQWAAVGALIDELTISFDDLDAPGAHPWTIDSTWMALNRVLSPLTTLTDLPAGLETMQGQNSLIHLGPLSEAFADLDELTATLISCSIATQRHLELRPYGGDTDGASGMGFTEKTSGTVTAKVRINSATKAAVYDQWENGSPFSDDQRIRIHIPGSGSKEAFLDYAIGLTAVPVGTRGGERVYELTGTILDDADADSMGQISIVNDQASLGDGYGS
jgi:hypothetical protein